ncbi:Ig-like domain-containing protein [Niabella yanshanensis]|uniref:Ig-like domain-containing protein n=1 Tax=Niabella yanshanensis TaxID=577386 RepID=A0ABZ0W8R9_9BACT|nr:Ig-like domain-containing protein [Niabella yanshanensis]WQD38535.1 Ig-like domain-containing protein [Niabella yanshanensis]
MIVLTAILSALLSVTAASSCVKNGNEYTLADLQLDRQLLIMEAGQAEQVHVTAIPEATKQVTVQWASADENVAVVDNGWVTAVGAGETTVTVSYKNIRKTVQVKVNGPDTDKKLAVLFDRSLSNTPQAELILNGVANYTKQGLNITGTASTVKLDKFYAIAERKVQYHIRLSADAKAIFHSSEKDFKAYVDVVNKKISIATSPVTEKKVDFLKADQDYIIEIYHVYQQARLRITDMKTKQQAEVSAVNDGQGGTGKGVLQPGFAVGMQWDYYCFGLSSGTSMLVKRIAVSALKKKVKLLLYGDSITQPEGYFLSKDFHLAWTQQVINKLSGNAMSSGRGGAQIDMVMNYIKNELPFIETEYVMVTIGTNGGNTEAKLKDLVSYIKANGAIPILNNIPSNESGTQVAVNDLLAKVRNDMNIKGCRFDLPTSIDGDGKVVDKSTMYWEDYSGSYGWQIYHHPNEIGGVKMFQQTLIDLPVLYQ